MSTDDRRPTAATVAFRGPAAVASTLPGESIPWFEVDVEDDVSDAATQPPPPRPAPRPPAPPTPGARIRDEGEIARGGMGAIRRLYDTELRRHVAMKVLEPELATTSGAKQRFIDEARVTGLLDHPNIVPVHDIGHDDRGNVTYTMKLVQGQTLSEVIAAQKTLTDLERILQSMLKVCDALSFAHSRGVIHRDLKPDNIMVGTHGQVYVMDWGLAQVIGETRSLVDGRVDPDGIVVGTLQYMAPEQARGEVSKIDPRTDIFALGAILYKAITGSPPYPGPPQVALVAAQLGEYVPPEEATGLAVKPPPGLTEIVRKAMAREPADRYQTAEALAEDLRAFLRGGNWFPLHRFAAGSRIVREGDVADAAYIITAGRCEVKKRDARGNEVVLRTLGPGDVFGETAIFANAPRSASVIALDDVSAVVVDRGSLDHLVRSSWLGLFVKALADRFLDLDSKMSSGVR